MNLQKGVYSAETRVFKNLFFSNILQSTIGRYFPQRNLFPSFWHGIASSEANILVCRFFLLNASFILDPPSLKNLEKYQLQNPKYDKLGCIYNI